MRAGSNAFLALMGLIAVTVTLSGAPASRALAAGDEKAFTWHDSPKPVPNLAFEDGAGAWRSLANFRGKVVLLNIWATWCAPCRREMPTLDRLQAKLGGRDFEVVALSIDRAGIPVVKKFYEELGLKALHVYVDKTSRTTQELGILGLPTTLLLDRSGHELGRLIGPAEWDSPAMIDLFRRHLEQRADQPPSGSGDRVLARFNNHEVIP